MTCTRTILPYTTQADRNRTVRWFSQLVIGLSKWRPGFKHTSVCVAFVVDKVALGQVFRQVLRFSPVSTIPPTLHIHSFIYHRRCIMFLSQYFSFPSQYHSTNAPYSFIHLPSTLYNVFLLVLRFSPVSISPPLLHTHSFIYHWCYTIASCNTTLKELNLQKLLPFTACTGCSFSWKETAFSPMY
jgi:hypothetical protein